MTDMAPSTDRPMLGRSMLYAIYGGLLLLVLLLGLAAFAPLTGGALATGTISPDSSRRAVQHLEGGVITQIFVRDGDRVDQGDALIALNETRMLTERNIVLSRLRVLQITEARLEAEQAGQDTLKLGFEVKDDDHQLLGFIERQNSLLKQSLDLKQARARLLNERDAQTRSEIEGLNSSIESLSRQKQLLEEEIKGAEILVEKGLYSTPRMLALQREASSLGGRIATTEADIARLEGQLSEIGAQRVELEADRQTNIASQLSDTRAEISTTLEQLTATEEVLSRTIIKSPVSGQVVGLRYKTIGGVVTPGDVILELVPANDRLIIEARISPTDIDIIQAGQSARITFSALPRNLPQFEGEVLRISGDVITDERTGLSHYQADIEVDISTLEAAGIQDKLVPGMPADVMIRTEARTLLSYLIQPFRDTLDKGLRESE